MLLSFHSNFTTKAINIVSHIDSAKTIDSPEEGKAIGRD